MATFESLSQFTPRERETRLAVNTALKPRGKGLAGIGASREHIDNQDSDDQVGGPMSMILGALHCTLSNPSSGSHNVNAPIENALMYQTTCSSPFIGTSAIQESTEPDPFSESDAEMLSSFFVWKSFGRGSIIWEADQKPDWLFIVEEGELELSIQDGGRLRVVETLICGTMVKTEGSLDIC